MSKNTKKPFQEGVDQGWTEGPWSGFVQGLREGPILFAAPLLFAVHYTRALAHAYQDFTADLLKRSEEKSPSQQ